MLFLRPLRRIYTFMKNIRSRFLYALLGAALLLVPGAMSARSHSLYVVTTGDVHGSWFAAPYVGDGATKTSLMSVKYYVDSLRAAVGGDNVLLLDAGDCLQGDNAAYYYNYVDTAGPHLFSRICAYMGYDAVTVGNHDIETGHAVYDRVNSELAGEGIPWLGGNALRTSDRTSYFPVYTVLDKGGLKVAVLGFTNPNIKAWLSEDLWSGMEFISLIPCVQKWVDVVNEKEKPDVVIVLVHSGTGEGDGSVLESQGLDLLASLEGVDLLVTAHDHRPRVESKGGTYMVNAGSRAGYVGYACIEVDKFAGRLRSKSVEADIVRLDKNKVDNAMAEAFSEDFEAVRAFTNRKVGTLAMDLYSREAFTGMSDFINLIHTVQLGVPEADISFAAPLSTDGRVSGGDVIYNDMFTIYPFENQLFVVRMRGSEIKDYLEYSYDNWIQTPGEHVLRIRKGEDPRYGTENWSFEGPTYNFDSAAGINYTVDVTRPAGSRVEISSLADGRPFQENGWYNVAMTSYRASGGGNLIPLGAGIEDVEDEGRVVARYPEIRDMIYDFISSRDVVTPSEVGDRKLLGEWKFVPGQVVGPLMKADMELVFGD